MLIGCYHISQTEQQTLAEWGDTRICSVLELSATLTLCCVWGDLFVVGGGVTCLLSRGDPQVFPVGKVTQ